MITEDNLKFAFENLNEEDCKQINGDGDYLKFELHSTNVGSYSTLESVDYCPNINEELSSDGNLFIDKDDFLRLYTESGAENPNINAYR